MTTTTPTTPGTVPAEIIAACRRLGWTVLGERTYGGQHAYLIRDESDITEPYTARTILAAAALVDRLARPYAADRKEPA